MTRGLFCFILNIDFSFMVDCQNFHHLKTSTFGSIKASRIWVLADPLDLVPDPGVNSGTNINVSTILAF